jgi:hypothetical protein
MKGRQRDFYARQNGEHVSPPGGERDEKWSRFFDFRPKNENGFFGAKTKEHLLIGDYRATIPEILTQIGPGVTEKNCPLGCTFPLRHFWQFSTDSHRVWFFRKQFGKALRQVGHSWHVSPPSGEETQQKLFGAHIPPPDFPFSLIATPAIYMTIYICIEICMYIHVYVTSALRELATHPPLIWSDSEEGDYMIVHKIAE